MIVFGPAVRHAFLDLRLPVPLSSLAVQTTVSPLAGSVGHGLLPLPFLRVTALHSWTSKAASTFLLQPSSLVGSIRKPNSACNSDAKAMTSSQADSTIAV